MARLKLIKGRSYTGEVKATRDKPFVETDEATAEQLVASGYFMMVSPEAEEAKNASKTSDMVNVSTDDAKAEEGAQDDEKKVSDEAVKKEAPAVGKQPAKAATKKTAKK